MSWQVSILLFYVASVSNALWQRVFAQKTKLSPKLPPAMAYVFGLLPLGIIVGLATRNVHIRWGFITALLLILEGSFIGLFNWLAFIAVKRLSVAVFQTLLQIYALTATILGWLWLKEGLSGVQIVGGILLVLAAVLASQAYKSNSTTKTKLRESAVVMAVLAAICLGIGLVAEKAALGRMTLGAYFIVGYATQALALGVIAAKDLSTTRLKAISKRDWLGSIWLGISSALLGFFYIYALNRSDNVSLVTIVSTFQVPLSAVAGYFVLKEKETSWKLWVAVGTGFVGLLITLR